MSALLRAANTHLYPGAKLVALARPRLRAGDRVIVEFADLGAANGRVERRDDRVVLAVEAHRTARGADVAARAWVVERSRDGGGDGASRWCVVGRA